MKPSAIRPTLVIYLLHPSILGKILLRIKLFRQTVIVKNIEEYTKELIIALL